MGGLTLLYATLRHLPGARPIAAFSTEDESFAIEKAQANTLAVGELGWIRVCHLPTLNIGYCTIAEIGASAMP